MTFPFKKVSRGVALEMMTIQDSSFGIQLETIVDKIRIGVIQEEYPSYDHLIRSGHIKALEQAIFNRTGLQMEIICSQDTAAILSFYANKHSIFIHPMWNGSNFEIKDQQAILDKAQNKKGTVDLKKAKVSGLFSEYKNKLFLNFHVMITQFKLTTPELTAIILHELGHAFYICEFSDRLETTNQVLANVAKELLNKKEKNLDYVYRELKSIDDTITKQAVEEIVNGHKVIAGYKLFNVILNSVVSQVSNAKYNETAFEQLADHFASKFGYGRYLVLALDKMHEYFNSPEKSKTYNTFNLLMSAIDLIIGMGYTVAVAITMGPMGGIAMLAFMTLLLRIAGEDFKDYTYDDLKIRYKRIRANYIDVIKKLDIPKSELKDLIDQIYAIDRIMSQTYMPVSIYNKIANALFSKAKKADESIREQQLLEDLAFNDLFLEAAQFRVLN